MAQTCATPKNAPSPSGDKFSGPIQNGIVDDRASRTQRERLRRAINMDADREARSMGPKAAAPILSHWAPSPANVPCGLVRAAMGHGTQSKCKLQAAIACFINVRRGRYGNEEEIDGNRRKYHNMNSSISVHFRQFPPRFRIGHRPLKTSKNV